MFRRKGYAETRLSDIASAAKTQAGSLYYHFQSREDLVEAVLRRAMEQISVHVRERVAAAGPQAPPLQRLEAALRAHILQVLALDDFTLAYEKIIDQVPPAIQRRYVHLPREYGRYLATLFDDAVASGELRVDVSTSLARLLVVGSVTWMVNWYRPGGGLTPEQVADQVIDIFLQGLRRPSP